MTGWLLAAAGDAVARISPEGIVELALGGSGAQCIAAGDGAIYAGCRSRGVWKSEDSGRTWDDTGLPQPDVFSVAVGLADGAVYAGCEPSALFRSDDGGRTWRELTGLLDIPSRSTWSFPPRPWTSHVRWIAPCPHDASLLLVGIELGGLMRSEDGGETWEDHRPGAKRDVHAIAWHPTVPGSAYEAAGDGTAWSFDGGRTWRVADDGRDRHYAWALAVDPDDPSTWFCSASTGPYAAHGRGDAQAALYRKRGEGPWERLGPLLTSMPYALCFADGRLLAGFADGTLSASEDRGETWQPLPLAGEPLPRVLALAAGSPSPDA